MSDEKTVVNIKPREISTIENKEITETNTKPDEYIVEDVNEDDETEEPITQNQSQITVINSIKTNWLSWLCIIIAIVVISHQNIPLGAFTFLLLMVAAYLTHRSAHDYKYIFNYKNIFTTIHHYHHENNNFFSHFSQMLLELTFPVIFVPLYYFYGTTFVDPWVVLLFVLFYSSVHNVNYAIFRVNNVHNLHHRHIHTNIGPDVCDIFFNSKHQSNTEVENTNHYIPNIILGTIVVLAVKYLYETNPIVKEKLPMIVIIFLLTSLLFLWIASVYLWWCSEKQKVYKLVSYYTNKYNNIINKIDLKNTTQN